MGSSKDLQEKGSSAAELFSTPEVLRRDASASQVAGRPGEKTPERSRSSRCEAAGYKDHGGCRRHTTAAQRYSRTAGFAG